MSAREPGWYLTVTIEGMQEDKDYAVKKALEDKGWVSEKRAQLSRSDSSMEIELVFSEFWKEDDKEEGYKAILLVIHEANGAGCTVRFQPTQIEETTLPEVAFECKKIEFFVAGLRFHIWLNGLGGGGWLIFDVDSNAQTTKFEWLGAMMLAHALNGIDISTTAYGNGIGQAVRQTVGEEEVSAG